MPERIAVAIDFSTHSERALEEAIAVARAVGAEVEMIHVAGTVAPDDESEETRELEEALRSQVREKFAALQQRYHGQGVSLRQSVVEGPVSERLCAAAAELGCRTIVVGTHGRTGLRRFFLGSVSEKVARAAKADVLVSRGSRPMRGYQRILVPTDFSDSAERALARAVAVAGPDAEIDLLHVFEMPAPLTTHYMPMSSHGDAVKRIAAKLREEAQALAGPLLATYRQDGVGIDFSAVSGRPGPTIVDRAAGCDLIVMGTHGRTGLARLVMGSVAEKTIRHAPCSVLTTHELSSKPS